MLAKWISTVVGLGVLAGGLAFAAEPSANNDHVLKGLAEKFRDTTLERFAEGINDPKLRENFSVDAVLLRRALLLLQSSGTPDTELKTLKEFPSVENTLRDFMEKSPDLKKLLEKKKFTIGDMAKVEKALLVNDLFADREKLMGELAVLLDVETEKVLDANLSTEEALKKLALRKLVTLPPEIAVGQRTPFLKELDSKLRNQIRKGEKGSFVVQ